MRAHTTIRRPETASSRARAVFVIVGLSASMLIGSAPTAVAGDGETAGAGGRRNTPAVTFGSFAAVGRYGVQTLPNDRPPRPPEETTDEEERSKALSDSGKAAPTTKRTVEAHRSSRAAPDGPRGGPTPRAPVLGRSFAGITGGTPPDTNLAAGPHDLIVVTNSGVAVRQKDGTLLNPGTPLNTPPTLAQFFASVTAGTTFDPRAVFDPYLQRFWVIAGAFTNAAGSNPADSRVVIALSTSNEAAGGWSFFQVDMRREGNTLVNQWCDYPMLGVSSDSVFISCNMFDFPATNTSPFQYAKVRIMSKGQFLTNTCCLWWDRWNLREGFAGGSRAFTVQPTTMFNGAGFGEFLINAHGGGGSGNVLHVWHIGNATSCCVPGAQSSPTWRDVDVPVGSYPSPPTGVQPGAAGIDTGGTRLQYAFWQNSRISTGQTTGCNDGSGGLDACLGFTELDVSAFPAAVTVRNDWVFQPANGTDLYFPAVAANNAGSKTMVYTRSSAGENPTAAFIGIPDSTVCTGCVDLPQATLRAGTASVTCGAVPCRWGDYHGASPDPDGIGVWITGQAMTTLRTSQIGLTRELGDFTPPFTTATLSRPPDDGDVHTSLPVTVNLTSADSGSGPWKIFFNGVNGFNSNVPPPTTLTATSTSVQVNMDGETSVRYRGTDRWGNQENLKSILVSVDRRVQKIVFASTRDGNPNGGHELYVMNPDGSNQVRLTNDSADDTQPALDAQGRVYFASNRDGDYEIYRLDNNGSVVQLTSNTGRDVEPAVRWNGSKIAFASDRTGNLEIHTMNGDGTGVSAPVNPSSAEDVEPDWSPINQLSNPRLGYVHNDLNPGAGSDDYNIYLTNPGMFLGTPGEDRRPQWGPNGRQVAATLIQQDPNSGALLSDIVIYSADTGSYSYLTPGGGLDDSATWSPHGGWIAFSSDATGNAEIHKIPTSGGTIVNLTNNAGQDVEPDWMALDAGYTPGVELPRIDISIYNRRPFDFHAILNGSSPYPLQQAELTLPRTGGLQYLSASGPGVDCNVDGQGSLRCFLGTLEPGERVGITVTAVASRGGVVTIRALTSSANGDPGSAIRFVPVAFGDPPTATVAVRDFRFEPDAVQVVLGGQVRWRFLGPSDGHSIMLDGPPPWDSGAQSVGSTVLRTFTSAGTYSYHSRLRPGTMLGTVEVPVQILAANLGGSTVAWSNQALPAGLRSDVEIRFRASPGDAWSSWAPWQTGVRTLAALFEPDRGPGEYAFRARVRQAAGDATTGWSPATIVAVP